MYSVETGSAALALSDVFKIHHKIAENLKIESLGQRELHVDCVTNSLNVTTAIGGDNGEAN